ncbi:hypothetical protein, conserved [Eimeria maxima]|uniref:Uncharacterized protein n=1 Tax=Eimeria maxima TaxID=5804 RepID=U6LXH5_EIMMA|nr:hypothetical protein, conserved [Eimeria maxima]CDJ56451.1 hypothetical protein, conserved [Eimeria maxima]
MGANNSTCLPCKVAGGNARRNRPLNGVHDPKILSGQVQVLKKVSTAAEPQGTSGTVSQSAPPQDPPVNGPSSSTEPLQECNETLQLQEPLIAQSHSEAPQQPVEVQRLKRAEQLQDEPSVHEREIRPDNETELKSKPTSSVGISSPKPKDETAVAGKQAREGSPMPQQHINVPSHMLAAGAEAVCLQHHGTQQALLSPHSCSVAHRVAAALRAAAGERAAAAAARAAEAAEAAKAMPNQHGGHPKQDRIFQTESSSAECGALASITGSTEDSTPEQQANTEQEPQRAHQRNSCFPHVSCFSSNDESASEITVRQHAEQYPRKPNGFPSPEQSIISAAKLVGEMFSGAAAAAVALASSTPGQNANEGAEQPLATSGDSCLVAGQGVRQATPAGSDKGGDLEEGAVVLLGAVDRAMDAITSDEFKKQASRY